MKLERINAAAQTELPNARPLRRNQRVSNISAPIPDRKRMPERTATGALRRGVCDYAAYDTLDSRASWDLFTIAKT